MFCLLGIGVLFSLPLNAQHPLYYSVNIENGLPSDEIYELVQDDFGLIWVASNSGLFSYDGVRVRRFAHPDEKSRAMIAVLHDAQDDVWCRNVAGQVFKVAGDSLQLMLEPALSQPIRGFAFDGDGGFCVVFENQLLRFDRNGKRQDSLVIDRALPNAADVLDIAVRKEKVYFFVSKVGVYQADFRTRRLEMILATDVQTAGGFNFKGTDLFVMLIHQLDQTKEVFQLTQGTAKRIFETSTQDRKDRWLRIVPGSKDQLWVCTVDGVFVIQKRGERWESGKRLFEEMPISSVLEDNEGITWFSTLSEGLFAVPSNEIFRILPSDLAPREANLLTLTALPNGSLVAGTFSGSLFQIDPQTFEMQEIYKTDLDVRKYPVRRILPYKSGILVSKGLISHADFNNRAMRKTNLLYHARDMTMLGDTLFAVLPNKVSKLRLEEEFGSRIPNSQVVFAQGGKAVELDEDGNLYFACNDGTFWLHNGTMQEVTQKGNKLNLNFLSAGKNGVWAAGTGIGLVLMHQGKVSRVVGEADGLPDLNLKSLFAFGEWVFFSTENEFCKLDLRDGSITRWTASVGFNPNHINDIAVASGRIWLATTKGIVSFPLDFKAIQERRPSIRIRNVFLNDKCVQTSGTLEVPEPNSELRIDFEGISFRSRKQFVFEYRIIGIDSQWTRSPSEANFANYVSLIPGELKFEVRMVDENGQTSSSPAVLYLNVATPFHQQVWFFLLIGIGILLASFAVFQVRLRHLRRRHTLQTQLISSQLTALKAQMNPHFMFNALNSIQDFVISKDVRNSNLYLSKFSTLMRKVLDASGQNQVLLTDEIEMLRLYLDLEQLRFGAEMRYEIECPADVDADRIFIPSMIIQPFVENAIKHGLLHKKGEKRLSIAFSLGSGLLCTITDNGVGRKRSAEIKARGVAHASFSTAATVKRLDLIQSLHGAAVALEILDLEEDGEAIGTRVLLQLLLMNEIQPLVK